MKTWIVTYKDKNFKSDAAMVVAPTYTMALLEFVLKYPECNYTAVLEVMI